MNGRRVADGVDPVTYEPGDYGRYADRWFVVPPGDGKLLGDVTKHTVVEHEDRTITVTPSILITAGDDSWHGYLTRGVWSIC